MSISPSYPDLLQNGNPADATQVMANFYQIQNDVNANAAQNGANSDITSITGLTTPLGIAYGGTGATSASAARTALGAAASGVNNDITSLTGILTPIAIAYGGTGASTASDARTALGLGSAAVENIGTDIVDSGGNLTLATVNSNVGSFTNANITVNAKGLITAAANGSAGVKAWGSCTVSGGIVTIRGSFNVSSVTYNSTGSYTVNFTSALATANFAVVAIPTDINDSTANAVNNTYLTVNNSGKSTGSCGIITSASQNGRQDHDFDFVVLG